MKQKRFIEIIKRLRPIMLFCAVIGLLLSTILHILTFFSIDVSERWPSLWWLHIGIFLLLIPELIVENAEKTDYLNSKHTPKWVVLLVGIFFVYALINFGLFFFLGEEFDIPETRGFSGHWMLFYAIAVKMLVGAVYYPIPSITSSTSQHAMENSPQNIRIHPQDLTPEQITALLQHQFSLRRALRGPFFLAIVVVVTIFAFNAIPVIVTEGDGVIQEKNYRPNKRGNAVLLEHGGEIVIVSSDVFWKSLQVGDRISKNKWSFIYELNGVSYTVLWRILSWALGTGVFAFLFWTIGTGITWYKHRNDWKRVASLDHSRDNEKGEDGQKEM